MKIITVAALKGGVGKTNFVFNLAGILAFNNKKILLIDLDPQANLTNNFKFFENNNQLSSALLFNSEIDLNKIKLIQNWKKNNNIDIIITNIAMTTLETELIHKTCREAILKKTFRNNWQIFNIYDYILIDTNPSINLVNKNALAISDEIIVISDKSANSLSGVHLLNDNWESFCKELNIKNNLNTIILNKINNYKISKDFITYISKTKFNKKVLKNNIKNKEIIAKSEILGIPIALQKQNKNFENPFNKIYQELIERGVL